MPFLIVSVLPDHDDRRHKINFSANRRNATTDAVHIVSQLAAAHRAPSTATATASEREKREKKEANSLLRNYQSNFFPFFVVVVFHIFFVALWHTRRASTQGGTITPARIHVMRCKL